MGVFPILSRKLLLTILALAVAIGVGGFWILQDPLNLSSPPSPDAPASDASSSSAPSTPSEVRLLDQATTTDVDADTGEPVDRTSVFTPSDRRVYAWVELGALSGERQLTWTWTDPSGDPAFRKTQAIGATESATDQGTWRTWTWIPTRSDAEGVQTGEWTVEARLGERTLLRESFTLQAEAATPSCGDPLYRDDFANAESGWVAQQGEASTWQYTDEGTYRISTRTESNTVWSWAPIRSEQLPERYCVTVDAHGIAEAVSAENITVVMGLVFGGDMDGPVFTTFGILPNRQAFRVRHRDFKQETSENRVDWTGSERIKGGTETNRLMIAVRPGQVSVFIDGRRSERLKLDATGDLGVFIESLGQAPAQAAFDNFTIRPLGAADSSTPQE